MWVLGNRMKHLKRGVWVLPGPNARINYDSNPLGRVGRLAGGGGVQTSDFPSTHTLCLYTVKLFWQERLERPD